MSYGALVSQAQIKLGKIYQILCSENVGAHKEWDVTELISRKDKTGHIMFDRLRLFCSIISLTRRVSVVVGIK